MSWGGWPFWIWIVGIVAIFLPIELYAALATPGKSDTFSEFVWWAFGVKTRENGAPVRYRTGRRVLLGAFLLALYAHLVFAYTVLYVIILGVPVGGVLAYAFLRERKQ